MIHTIDIEITEQSPKVYFMAQALEFTTSDNRKGKLIIVPNGDIAVNFEGVEYHLKASSFIETILDNFNDNRG